MRTAGPLRLVLAALVIAMAMTGCGSSGGGMSSTGEGSGGPGEATTSTAPSGIHTTACVDEALEPPEVVVIGASCGEARRTVAAWEAKGSCSSPEGASHSACTIGRLRCIGTSTDRGIAVNCSRPNSSISFIEKPH
jgi:hypothetical protein